MENPNNIYFLLKKIRSTVYCIWCILYDCFWTLDSASIKLLIAGCVTYILANTIVICVTLRLAIKLRSLFILFQICTHSIVLYLWRLRHFINFIYVISFNSQNSPWDAGTIYLTEEKTEIFRKSPKGKCFSWTVQISCWFRIE